LNPEIITLDEITDESVGGKAYGLSRLVSMGLAVPPAFVICRALPGQFPEQLFEHRERLGQGKLAVRSSARGEDGADASFAGQYDSVLNVDGDEQLREAIDHCANSLANLRAQSYVREQHSAEGSSETSVEGSKEGSVESVVMNVVVQRMVDAAFAGVVFTADPVSARRELLVIDSVEGLGEALVSGEATPDHYEIDPEGQLVLCQPAGESPMLSAAQLSNIAVQARSAELKAGQPLDLEWAIDQAGELFWLQARPITTLPADLNEFDTTLPRPDDVLTISNVSEMMPGAVSPLTGSFTGWGIDYGLQHMQVSVGARSEIDPNWQITAWAYGHLFLNLTGNVVMGAGVLGSSAEQTAQTLCGRIVPELKELPPLPFWKRLINTGRLLHYCYSAPAVVDKFDVEMANFAIPSRDESGAMWAEIESRAQFFNHAMAVHIQSSALSGFFSAIVENMVSSRSNDSTIEEQAEAVRLLAGASGVESAEMLAQLDELVEHVSIHPEAATRFVGASANEALNWLRSIDSLGGELDRFLQLHGHRGYRELCIRDPAWIDDLEPLVQSMQVSVRAHLGAGEIKVAAHQPVALSGLSRGLQWALPRAHRAIRRREHTKSHLVSAAHQFKVAFRRLGSLLEKEAKLPDSDLVYFLSFNELGEFVKSPQEDSIERALKRREALQYQQQFTFAEISVGIPRPLKTEFTAPEDGVIEGRPASTGIVEGRARVAHTLVQATELQSGEILVTPITDIGWTPYFSLIAGLVTDLGSSVSHGAVIAREYGLPCIVNTRSGTQFIRTGDTIRLDGDTGKVTIVQAAEE
jgi:phosphoenolpyruvate synthase/pyruvate phosphate dikinase